MKLGPPDHREGNPSGITGKASPRLRRGALLYLVFQRLPIRETYSERLLYLRKASQASRPPALTLRRAGLRLPGENKSTRSAAGWAFAFTSDSSIGWDHARSAAPILNRYSKTQIPCQGFQRSQIPVCHGWLPAAEHRSPFSCPIPFPMQLQIPPTAAWVPAYPWCRVQ